MRTLFALTCLTLVACTNWGPTQSEEGVVEQVIYSPSQDYSGVGLGGSGDVSFVSGSTDDKYTLVFKCVHGKFAIGSGRDRDRDMWKVLSVGDRVLITYRADTERPGHLDFLSAIKVKDDHEGWGSGK